MSMEETVTFNLELNVEPALLDNVRQVEGLLTRTFGFLNRLGLPPQIERAINTLQRLIMTIRILHSAVIAFESSNPLGLWRSALAVGSAVTLMTNMTTDFSMGMGE